ncbi:MAG: response regulator transcription factor [Sphingomonas sp.]|uniref:response regulator transcription factor n=1 Tax=Sphingomonas sp. TaxID=28214 RepID=UPI00356B543F
MNILLVEDDPGIGRFVSRGLSAEGYNVEWQRGGAGAAARLATAGFAAAVLDLGLPDIDGIELCRALRRDGIDTPVLMLTARATLEDRLDGFRCGADDYLPKPFSFDELVLRLGALTRRAGAAARTISLGAMAIDTIARVVTVDAAIVPLSPREFDLLLCFAGQPDLVVTRAELLDRVWGAEAEISDNSIDVYVGYLRRRLERFPGAPMVRTIRRRGYRLDIPPSDGSPREA